MTRDRYFYTLWSFLMVVLLIAGFHRFLLEGVRFNGNAIPPSIFAAVIIHGIAVTL